MLRACEGKESSARPTLVLGRLCLRTRSLAVALARAEQHFQMSKTEADMMKVPRGLFEQLTETLCYAA